METTLLITVLGIVITVLVSVLGWVVIRGYRMRDKKEDRLVQVTDQLHESQHRLDITVIKLSENIVAQTEIIKLKHNIIDSRLNKHRDMLTIHDRKLIDIEKRLTKINNI
jgi:hypothetical protein